MARLLLCFLFVQGFLLSFGQVSIEIGGAYALPRFDSYFRYEFESKVGMHAGVRFQRSDKISVGLSMDRLKFQPYAIPVIGLEQAIYTGINIFVTYPALQWESAVVEASIGGGYGLFSYNKNEQKSQALQFDLGARFLWYPEEDYAISFKISRLQYSDRFAANWNPYQSGNLRMILFSAGLIISI